MLIDVMTKIVPIKVNNDTNNEMWTMCKEVKNPSLNIYS